MPQRQPSDPPWSPSGRLWGSGVPSTRSQCWALGRAFEHACRPVSGRASRLKNASLAEASLGLSRLQKERPHGWRGGPRQSRDERRFVYVLPHRCSTSTKLNYLISPKTSLFFRFMEAPGVLSLSISIIYSYFYTCSAEFFRFSFPFSPSFLASPPDRSGDGSR